MKQRNFLKYFVAFLVFSIVFALSFIINGSDLEKDFLLAISKVPSIRNFGSGTALTIKELALTWGPLVGLGLGLVAWIISLVYLGIIKLIRLAKYNLISMAGLILIYGAYLALAIELIYFETRYSAITIGIIIFVGYPLFHSAIATLALIIIIYLMTMLFGIIKPKQIPETEINNNPEPAPASQNTPSPVIGLVLLATSSLFFPGCSLIAGAESLACLISADSAHCYQDQAVSSGNADDCDKIKQPEQFIKTGSNPPKDKCYLMVAQNTGNLEACKKIKGGLLSYTQEECILTTSVENENPIGCTMLTGSSRGKCEEKLGPKMTADKALEVDDQIEIIKKELAKGSDPGLEAQLKGLEERRNGILAIMTKENKEKYDIQSDPINKEIIGDWAVGDIDSETKNKLVDMNQKLKSKGAGLTKEQYETFKDYYKFINDPENDIEKMDDNQIVKNRLGEKLTGAVDKLKFWKVKDTDTEKKLDEQLRFYERMVERQAAIDKGLSVKEMQLKNALDTIKEKAGDAAADAAKDKIVEEIFGNTAGTAASLTTKVLEEALNEVKSQAKSAEFRGLVKAYDSGMEEEISKFGGDVEKAHVEVIKKISADPYAYADGNSFAKYGNLVENKSCDGTNPHCINKDIFWKSMKKSYKYQHP